MPSFSKIDPRQTMTPGVTPSTADLLATAALAEPLPNIAAIPSSAEQSRKSYWTGKVAIVTGGSSGFGRSLAAAFARSGAHVVISARSYEALESAADELRRFGTQILAVPADITQNNQVESLVEHTIRHFGRLDVLVNNAGRSARGTAIDVSPEEFNQLLDLNFLGAVRCTRAAMPHLLRSRGHLVNIGSLSGKSASRYVGAYAATKFALAAYTQQLRLELSPQGVHVMLVSSGPIERRDAGQRYSDRLQGLPAQAAKPGAGVRINPINPDKLSRAILVACRRRQPELIFPAMAGLFFAVLQLFPRLGDWLVRRMT
ncbi:MAG: SDR family NAD(P)-dependent oxidoreductase [Pirellulales bacterium]|nr:SDR family NAD(P)-dependent oxidoreductase [Pirellulales bacterium]